MLKRILLTTLAFNIAQVAANTSAMPVLIRQCLAYSQVAQLDTSEPDIDVVANHFERQTLGLHNLNDMLKYYRQFSPGVEARDGLLNCQLKLADQFDTLLAQEQLPGFIKNLRTRGDAEQRLLARQLTTLSEARLDVQPKSELYLAQNAVSQGLKHRHLTLNITGRRCQLSPNPDSDPSRAQDDDGNFAASIASYLIRQADPDCRSQVWQAYQGRAREINRLPIQKISQIRLTQARKAGFADYAHWRLQQEYLSTPALVGAFLNSQTLKLGIAPWEIGNSLARAEPTPAESLSGQRAVNILLSRLGPLGFSFDRLRDDLLRVWHGRRLLGELVLSTGTSNRHRLIRRSVLGRQFGQGELSYQTELKRPGDRHTLTLAMAQAMVSLARGSRFYLNNAMGQSQDSVNLAEAWLAQYLQGAQGNVKDNPGADRESLARRYVRQLRVFRAKVALNHYLAQEKQIYPDLAAEFYAGFGSHWDEANDYQYSFGAIAREGPLYYQSLWQEALAEYIYRRTQSCQDQQTIFNTLVIAASASTLTEQLTALLGEDVSPESLISKISHETINHDPTLGHCPF